MKRILLCIIGGLLLAGPGLAQTPRTVATQNGVLIEMSRITGTGTSPWFRVEQYGVARHTLVYVASGGIPSNVTVSLDCSRDGSSLERSLGTATAVGGGSIASGYGCPWIRASVTSTDSQAIVPVYTGVIPAALAAGPAASACGGIPYDSGLVQVPSGYPTTLTSVLTCVSALSFMNTTNSPILVMVRDGSGNVYANQYVAPLQPLSIPFNNNLFSGGLQWTASTSGLNGQVKGYQ